MSSYTQWEGNITELVAEDLQVSYGDAAGVIEAQSFCMQQSWCRGMDAKQTSERILEIIVNGH